MAQDFSLRYPLVDPHGNFGSVDGDPPAATRYTEARLAPIAMELLRDIDAETVDFVPNYDGYEQRAGGPARAVPEPAGERLGGHRGRDGDEHPAAQPRRGDRRASSHLIDNPEATPEDLMKFVKGPDFPTGALIMGREGIRDAYETGRGSIKVRAASPRSRRNGQGARSRSS